MGCFSGLNVASVTLRGTQNMQEAGQGRQFSVTAGGSRAIGIRFTSGIHAQY